MAVLSQKVVLALTIIFINNDCTEGRSYDNNFDRVLDYECYYSSYAISSIYSYHHNGFEDRRFSIGCRSVPYASGSRTCSYSANWENDYDRLLSFHCPPNLYIVRMRSEHYDITEDRRWKFRCCGYDDIVLHGCELTGWTNDMDGRQSFTVPSGKVITGVVSYHENSYEDRRYKYNICKVGKFPTLPKPRKKVHSSHPVTS